MGLDAETVSPLLFAVEGANRRLQTPFEMHCELRRAERILRALLPGAKIQSFNKVEREAIYSTIQEHSAYRGRASRLLVRAAPLVVNPPAPHQRLKLEEQILQLAKEEGVSWGSLAVLCLMSCIYDANPKLSAHITARPGRAVLKPKSEGRFNFPEAYNALSDLQFIELMLHAHAIFPEVQPVLYTRDEGLAALWSVLQPAKLSVEQRGNGKLRTSAVFSLRQGLFPTLDQSELLELKSRLEC